MLANCYRTFKWCTENTAIAQTHKCVSDFNFVIKKP